MTGHAVTNPLTSDTLRALVHLKERLQLGSTREVDAILDGLFENVFTNQPDEASLQLLASFPEDETQMTHLQTLRDTLGAMQSMYLQLARSAPVMIRFLDMKLRNEIRAGGEDPYREAEAFVGQASAGSSVVPASAGGEQAKVSPGAKPPEGGTTNGETTNGEKKVEKVMHSAAHSF